MKMPSRDAYGDELEDSDCIPRLLEDVQSVHVVSSYFAHANPPRRLFEGGVCRVYENWAVILAISYDQGIHSNSACGVDAHVHILTS